MSRKFKSQASSARAASAAFGSPSFGAGVPTSFQTTQSSLSYVAELPDLTGISDPNLVVSFKNLGKKDSVTKSKALEDIKSYLFSPNQTSVEPAVLEAWVCDDVAGRFLC
jgi:E3 ubiquitin-protein ligase listerin